MSVTIRIKDAVKKFGNDTVINGLNVQVEPGEFFTLLGPSGCGKTTLLRMIIGFNSIEGGEFLLDDRLINNVAVNERNIGMVFQNYAVFPHMSVRANVAFGLKMRKIFGEEADRRISTILKTVKIDHLADRMPDKLSGGQQQRVALARALVIEPAVLLMDEPLSNLDAKLRVEMRNVIKEIQREFNITTVYVTHDQEEALAVSDRIAVMNNGQIQQIDTPKRIYRRPTNTFVATFIGLSNLFSAYVGKRDSSDRTHIIFDSGNEILMNNIRAKSGDKVIVSARPEEIIIQPESEPGLPAQVLRSVFLGTSTHYFLRTADGQEMEVLHDDSTGLEFADGAQVHLQFVTEKINVFDQSGETNLVVE